MSETNETQAVEAVEPNEGTEAAPAPKAPKARAKKDEPAATEDRGVKRRFGDIELYVKG